MVSLSDLRNADGTWKTGFPVIGDRTKVGKYTPIHPGSDINIDLQGGPDYGQQDENYGKAAWATQGPATAKKFENKINDSDGLGYVTLQAPEAARSNNSFSKAYLAETEEGLAKGRISPVNFQAALDSVVSHIQSRAKGGDPFNGTPPKNIEDLRQLFPTMTFEARKGLIDGLGSPAASQALGTVSVKDVLKGFIAHPDKPTGSIVSVLQFDKDHPGAVSASDLGVPAHDSYRFVHAGVHLGDLTRPIDIYEMYADELQRSRSWFRSLDMGRPIKSLGSGIILDHGALKPDDLEALRNGRSPGVDSDSSSAVAQGDGRSGTGMGGERLGGAEGGGRATHVAGLDGQSDLGPTSGRPGGGGGSDTKASDRRASSEPGAAEPKLTQFPRDVRALPKDGIAAKASRGRLGSKSKVLYANHKAYREVVSHLGAHQTSKGVHFNRRDAQNALSSVTTHAELAVMHGDEVTASGLRSLAAEMRSAIAGDDGELSVVRIHAGIPAWEVASIRNHELTHGVSNKYPLSHDDYDALTRQGNDPSSPTHGAYQAATEALRIKGYSERQLWRELPSWISGGPQHYRELGISDADARALQFSYLKKVLDKHGADAINAFARVGGDLTRQVGKSLNALDVPPAMPEGRALDSVTKPSADPADPLRPLNKKITKYMTAQGVNPSRYGHVLGQHVHNGTMAEMGLTPAQQRQLSDVHANAIAEASGSDTSGAAEPHLNPAASTDGPDASLGKWPIPTTEDEILGARSAGLLSSPKMMGRILASHLSYLGLEEASRIPGSVLDGLVSHVTGKDRTLGGASVPAMLRAAKLGATQGVREGLKIIKNGPASVASPLSSHHPQFTSTSPLLEKWVNGVHNAHTGTYHAIKVYALSRSLSEQASLQAMNEARQGLITGGKKAIAARAEALYQNPSPAMLVSGITESEEAVFQGKNILSSSFQTTVDHMEKKGYKALPFAARFAVPYPTVPVNVGLKAAEYATGTAYAPLRFAQAVMKQHGTFSAEDQRSLSRTFGRGATGAALIGLGVALAHRGVTKASEESKQRPGFIQMGGRWFPTSGVAPFANLVQLGIDLKGASDHHDQHEPMHLGDALGSLLTEQPMLKLGATNPTDFLSGDYKGQRLVGSQLGSLIPSALNDVSASTDSVKRRTDGYLGPAMNRIPGLREKLSPRLDAFGETIPEEGVGKMFDFTNSVPVSPMDTPAMQRLQYYHDNPVAMDPETRQVKQQLTQKGRNGTLTAPDIRAAVQGGQLSRSAGSTLYREANTPNGLDPRVQEFGKLPVDRAVKVYDMASPEEQRLFGPTLQKRLGRDQMMHPTPQGQNLLKLLGPRK